MRVGLRTGLTALVALGWYAVLGADLDAQAVTVTAALLAGGVAAFLPWNLPRARLFLGDTGSYALGMALPALGLVLYGAGASWWEVLAPLVVYGADVAWTLADRIRRREPWHQAHRDHVYQAVSLRLGHPATALLVAATSTVACLLCRLLDETPVALVIAWAVLLGAYLASGQLGRSRRTDVAGQ